MARLLSLSALPRWLAKAMLGVLAMGLAPAGDANSQPVDPAATAMSFEAANRRLESVSATLSGADHATRAARETAAAVATLNRPVISVSAQYLEYQKTLSIDLTGARQEALDDTQGFLSGLPATVPPAYQDIVGDITGRISQALPGLFAAIPDELSYRYRDDVFRPTVQAVLPLYTGGAITAVKQGAAAGSDMAAARAAQARDLARISLIRSYFGQLAAQSLEDSARETRDALDKLLDDTRRLEAEGFVPRARTLEAQVARDTAERAWQRARLAHQSARSDLARLLEVDAVQPTTGLFVLTRPLDPAPAFLERDSDIPQTRQADAAARVARAGVDIARSRYRPQAFAFGEYNLSRDNALPTDPDWVVGVGVRYTLLSNIDRGHALTAAQANAAAASDAAREARNIAIGATLRAWDLVEAARRSFVLLDSSLAAARENLRVQQIAFREGEGTLTTVLGAEAALAAARSQRIATAYEYDLALAGLLAASGQLDGFADYLARADIRLLPGDQP